MSANDIKPITAKTSQGTIYIGGVNKSDTVICAEKGAGVFLLSARPEHYGALSDVLELNPDMPVYATAAALRSVKQILNRGINEHLIKNGMKIDEYEFRINPDVSWIDSVSVYKDGQLILRETQDIPCYKDTNKAYIIYASRYGFTKQMAEAAAAELSDTYDVVLKNAYEMTEDEFKKINECEILLIGTHTIDRNAPECIWKVIASINASQKRGMNYLVFGSYGWAGDGIGLINSVLKEMGMKPVSKPVRALFRPDDDDIKNIQKTAVLFKKLQKS